MALDPKDPYQQHRLGRAPLPHRGKRQDTDDQEERPAPPPPEKAATPVALLTPVAPLALAGLAASAMTTVGQAESRAEGLLGVKDYEEQAGVDETQGVVDASTHDERVRLMEEQRRREAEARRQSQDAKVRAAEAAREEMIRLAEEMKARVDSRLTTLRGKYTVPPVGVARRIESLAIEAGALANLHISLHAVSSREVSEWPERMRRALAEAEQEVHRMEQGDERLDAWAGIRSLHAAWASSQGV
jgi:hypothetical protein